MERVSFVSNPGRVRNMIDFVVENQLSDRDLWALFVRQFGTNADCEDSGWRGEYWGKMMRGACLLYKATHDETLYGILEESVESLLAVQDEEGRISTYDKADAATEFWLAPGQLSWFDLTEREESKEGGGRI